MVLWGLGGRALWPPRLAGAASRTVSGPVSGKAGPVHLSSQAHLSYLAFCSAGYVSLMRHILRNACPRPGQRWARGTHGEKTTPLSLVHSEGIRSRSTDCDPELRGSPCQRLPCVWGRPREATSVHTEEGPRCPAGHSMKASVLQAGEPVAPAPCSLGAPLKRHQQPPPGPPTPRCACRSDTLCVRNHTALSPVHKAGQSRALWPPQWQRVAEGPPAGSKQRPAWAATRERSLRAMPHRPRRSPGPGAVSPPASAGSSPRCRYGKMGPEASAEEVREGLEVPGTHAASVPKGVSLGREG